MNYSISILISILAIMAFSSCKDSIVTDISPSIPTNESVSGTAFFDISGDGIGEEPMVGSAVFLGDSMIISAEDFKDTLGVSTDWLKTTVDSDGNYFFESVIPLENQVLRIFPNHAYSDLIGVDNTLDGDINEAVDNALIQISIDEDESDDGNDFVAFKIPIVQPVSISGYVLEDIDFDLIGDLPVADHRIELYERNSDGFPMTSTGLPLAASNSLADGFYEFKNIPAGEYVIYHIGTGDYPYTCVANMDQSPEAGEPTTNVGCPFIPVNLTDVIIGDQDNVYVISKTDINEPGSLSGTIFEDITSDGQPDEVTDIHVNVNIYERDADGFETGPILYTMDSNSEGGFSLAEIAPGNYVIKLSQLSTSFTTIFGSANGGSPQPLPDVAPLNITPGSQIEAYFWIFTNTNIPSINGRVYEDTNGDGSGDTPQYDHTIELYVRGIDNLPVGDLLYKTNSTGAGTFQFTNLSTNEYVLVLTGPSDYMCTASGDESPESGEPISTNGCTYIPVNFMEGTVDNDNNYTVLQQ